MKQDFLTNNVLRGDTQVNHRLSDKSDIIAGLDFPFTDLIQIDSF